MAIVHDTGFKRGVGAISSINNWYGNDDIPLGAYKGIFGDGHSDGVQGNSTAEQNRYAQDLISKMPGSTKDYDDVPSAVELLRKTLAAQEDNSVVISSIGMTTNMRDLVQSKGGDQYSPLNGHDLIA